MRIRNVFMIANKTAHKHSQLHANRRKMSSLYMFKDEEMESVMGATVCCPDIPSGLKFLLPQLLRVWSPNFRSLSL